MDFAVSHFFSEYAAVTCTDITVLATIRSPTRSQGPEEGVQTLSKAGGYKTKKCSAYLYKLRLLKYPSGQELCPRKENRTRNLFDDQGKRVHNTFKFHRSDILI